jgi:hypothetical protein
VTVHIVYPSDRSRIAAPWSIGNHLIDAISDAGYNVAQYDWMDESTIRPCDGDILLGHPHPSRSFIVYNSWSQPFAARYLICPYNGTDEYIGQVDGLISSADHFFPICGPYWASRLPAHWVSKSTPLDIAVDLSAYLTIKTGFNPVGSRSILNVGCTLPSKGPDYLAEIIAHMPGVKFGHLGHGIIPGAINYGYVSDMRNAAQELCKMYDFILCPGRNDANPTTLIEFAMFGMVPISAHECGWDDRVSTLIPFGRADEAVQIINRTMLLPEDDLLRLRCKSQKFIEKFCTWKVFTGNVLSKIFGGPNAI